MAGSGRVLPYVVPYRTALRDDGSVVRRRCHFLAMSWFGGGGQSTPPEPAQPAGPDPVKAAMLELECYTDLFNKMSDMCFQKCMSKMKDGDLNVGEMSCVDRCVGKYLEAHDLVGKKLAQENEKAQALAQTQQSMQQSFGLR